MYLYSENAAYRTGIRLRQAINLFKSKEYFQPLEMSLSIDRLEVAVKELSSQVGQSSGVDAAVEMIASIRASWKQQDAEIRVESELSPVVEKLESAARRLELSLQSLSNRLMRWLALGMEIADGLDRVWSDGNLYLQPRKYNDDDNYVPLEQRLLYDELIQGPKIRRKWEWTDRAKVNSLIEQLNVSKNALFSRKKKFFTSEGEIFQGLPFQRFWGWYAIEDGLRNLAQNAFLPCWNKNELTLSIGLKTIHEYKNPSENQKLILTAFQEQGWPPVIECPVELLDKENATIKDMNRTLGLNGFNFSGGKTGIRFSYSEPKQK